MARRVDGNFILHDTSSGSVHRLNAVAGAIWHLCDGTRDPRAITAEVAALFEKPPGDVALDVDRILAHFTDSGLIHSVGGARRETALLVQCVRTAIGTQSGEQLRDQIGEDVNWSDLVQTAREHGVMPLLYRSLRANARALVPGLVLDRLKRLFRANTRWNLFLTRELLELLSLFEAHGLPAIPLKGPVQAVSVYGNLAMRQFGDLDIFVPADQFGRAKALLTARGYRFRWSGEMDAIAECSRHDGKVKVDLQWALAAKRFSCPVDLAQLWGRLESVSLGNATVRQPAPVDQALIMCAHGAKHCWSKLGWIADMAVFTRMQRNSLNWRHTMDRASQLGGERLMLLGLRLASDVLGTDVPTEALARMRADTSVASLAAELHQRLFAAAKPKSFQGSYGVVEGALLYVRSRERVQDKLPYGLHLLARPFRRLKAIIVPNDHDRAMVSLPKYATFLYYVIRPMRLTRKYGARLVRSA